MSCTHFVRTRTILWNLTPTRTAPGPTCMLSDMASAGRKAKCSCGEVNGGVKTQDRLQAAPA